MLTGKETRGHPIEGGEYEVHGHIGSHCFKNRICVIALGKLFGTDYFVVKYLGSDELGINPVKFWDVMYSNASLKGVNKEILSKSYRGCGIDLCHTLTKVYKNGANILLRESHTEPPSCQTIMH